MSTNSLLTLLALLASFLYLGRKLLSTRDLLLVSGAAGTVGFLLAGAFHSWALIVGLSFLAATSFYLGFVYKTGGKGELVRIFDFFMRIRSQTAFVMSLALVGFVLYAMDHGRRVVAEISRYIDIYEPNFSVEPVWRVSDDLIGTVLLETGDAASSVLAYYRGMGQRDGWDISAYSPPTFASLQKDDVKLTLIASESGRGGTTLVISLRRMESR